MKSNECSIFIMVWELTSFINNKSLGAQCAGNAIMGKPTSGFLANFFPSPPYSGANNFFVEWDHSNYKAIHNPYLLLIV
jgi:hypothetical protein